jgi:hypothetical protein
MSLENNVRYLDNRFKGKKQERHSCPYCGFNLCWHHGKYPRKGFHRRFNEPTNQVVWIPRCLCRSPACGRSFCLLPAEVLPYQRFLWPDFLHIAEMVETGKNPYRIAGALAISIGLAVIVRTVQRIREFRTWVTGVAQELDAAISRSLKQTVTGVVRVLDWFRFTRRWFHALYPARICPEGNPHNSALSP